MVVLSLLFIGPVAVLVPPFVFPDISGPGTRFRQILFVYFSVIVFEIFLVYGSVQLRVYLGPSPLLDLPGSGAIIYAGLAILDILVAFAVYRILSRLRPAQPVPDGKPV